MIWVTKLRRSGGRGPTIWEMRVVCALLLLGALALGQDLEVLLLSPPAKIRPGDFAVQVWQVGNRTASPIVASFQVELPPGWEALGLPEGLSLGPGEEDYLFLTLYVPRSAPSGIHRARVCIRWEGKEILAEAAVEVEAVAALELSPPLACAVAAGESVVFVLRVRNRGNALDRVGLEVRPPVGWEWRLHPSELSLSPGETGEAQVTLALPGDTPLGRAVVMAVARSQLYPEVEARAAWYAEVLPPGPEQVPVRKFAELSMHGLGRMSYDFLTGQGRSFLGFTGRGPVLGGALELAARWAGPWAPQPFRFLDFGATYVTDAWQVEAGRVGFSFPSLLSSLAFWGLSARFSRAGLGFSLGSGWEQETGQAGAWVVLWPSGGEVGGAYRETRGEGLHSQAGAVWLGLRALEGLGFRVEAGAAQAQGLTRYAGQMGLTWEIPELFFLEARAYALDPNFPAPTADRAGVLLSGRVGAKGSGFRFTGEWQRDDLRGLSPPRRIWQGIQVGWDLSPTGWPLRLSSDLSLRRVADLALPPRLDERTARVEAGAVFVHQGFTAGIHGAYMRLEDLSHSVWTRTEFRERLDLRISPTGLFSGSFTQTVFFSSEEVLIQGDAAFSLVLAGGIRLDWEYGRAGGLARLEISGSPAPPLELTLRLAARWGEEGAPTSFSVALDFDCSFSWAPPFLPVHGVLSGEVFSDLNGDGRRDPGEPGVPGVVLALDDVRVSTGAGGAFRFPGSPPGDHILRVLRVPPGYAAPPEGLPVHLDLGEETTRLVPLAPLAELRGTVFLDVDGDGLWQEGEPGLARAYVRIVSEGEQVGEVFSDAAGRWSWSEFRPGRYRVELLWASLPPRHEPTTPTRWEVLLGPGERRQVYFGVRQRPRPVVVVQPPAAEFAWTPGIPQAGEPVLFDGTLSQADDAAELVQYAWDFDDDGQIDAEGARVTWVFPAPGFYLVTLTVTDSTGLTGFTQYLLQVQP